ncbi:hypothetical protein BH09VER1_BH09VER1_07040 [soil metagenome]
METSPLTFAHPAWFYALLIVPVVAGLYIWSHRRSRTLIGKIVAPRLRNQLAGAVSVKLRVSKAILVLLTFTLIVFTLAQPQMGYIQTEVKQTGRDIILAIDTSRSMLATDVTPTRLARAKLVALDIMRLSHGDRMGVIAFAGSAFLQAPLTVDYTAVLNTLGDLDTNIIPKGGTNIAAAIDTAVDAFGKGEGQSRALIILTDGEELDADGVAAAKKASEAGIHIFTVGIGSAEGSLIPVPREGGGGVDFVRDASGKSVTSRLDETRLKEIAAAGHGFYEPIGPEVAKSIYDKGILPMAETEKGMETSRRPIEKFQSPLSGAIALLALWLVLGERRRASSIRRAAAGAALLFLTTGVSHAANGYEDYQAGQYDKAMSDFEQRLKAQPNSEQLQFDAGVAAYKLGDYGKAVDYFTKGLLAEDKKLKEDASYNLGNALVRRGEAAKGNDEKKSDWKNAIQHYTEALNVDPKNTQAKENRDIVKKMLEDLEKQEKQQQDQKKDQQQQDKKDQKQDQKDQQGQQGQKDQQNQKDQKQDSKDQQKQDQKNDQNQKSQDQKNQQDQKSQQDQKNQQNQKGQQGNDQKDGKDQQKKDQQDQAQNKGDKDQQGKNQKPDQKQDQNDQNQPKEGNQDQQKKDQGQGEKDKPDQEKNQPKNSGQQLDQSGTQQPTPQPTPGEKKQGELKAAQEKNEPQQGKEGEAVQAGQESKDGEMTAAQAKSLLNSLRSEEAPMQKMQRAETEDVLKDW